MSENVLELVHGDSSIKRVAIAPQMPPAVPPAFLDENGCGNRYGFSPRHWRRLVDAGQAPPPTKFGRLRRWSIDTLSKWEAGGCQRVRPLRRKGGSC